MGILEGAFSTSGVIGGSYIGWCFEWVPVEISIVQPEVKMAMEDPDSYAMDEFTVLATVTNQNTDTTYDLSEALVQASFDWNSQGAQDSFSMVLADAPTWSPFGAVNPDVLRAGDLAKVLKFFVRFKIRGATHTFRVFTGTITASRPTFRRGNSSMNVTGANLAEFLRTQDGSIAFSGTLYNLLTTLLVRAGIRQSYLPIADSYIAVTLFSTTVEASIAELFRYTAALDHYVDEYGFFVARAGGAVGAQSWTYDTAKNVSELQPGQTSGALVTQVNTIGVTTTGDREYGDADKQAIFGYRQAALSSVNQIGTAAEADAAAQEMIDRTFRAMAQLSVTAKTINPVMVAGDTVDLSDDEVNGIGSNMDGQTLIVRWRHLDWKRSNPGGSFAFGGDLDE